MIALSDSANQALYLRWFLIDQGYEMGPVTFYQDNTSTMALVDRGKPGAERTRHIDIRYFWLADRVKRGVAVYGTPGIHGLRYTATACYTGHR